MGIQFSMRRYAPGLVTPRHAHALPLLCYVIDGSYTEFCNGNSRACKPATLLFHPPDETHGERFHAQGGRSLIVEFDRAWLERSGPAAPGFDSASHPAGPLLTGLGARLYREFHAPDELSPMVAEGLILQILGESARRQPVAGRPVPPWLNQARDLLRARFAEKLTLAEIGAAAGVHPVHLAQRFARWQGCTIGEYLRRCRADHARQRLLFSRDSLQEIARASGFSDQSHFTRTFRRFTGSTPARYRALHRS